MNGMNTATANLKYLLKKLDDGSYKKDLSMMEFALSEAIDAVKESHFTYTVEYKVEKSHFETYRNYGKRYMAILLTDLQEIQKELSSLKPNMKRCLALIHRILKTDFYRSIVQKKLDMFVIKQGNIHRDFIII